MKASHRQILKWLKDGARIWSAQRSRFAYVVLPNGHPEQSPSGPRVRRATLEEMDDAGLIRTESATQGNDTVWELIPRGKPLIEILVD